MASKALVIDRAAPRTDGLDVLADDGTTERRGMVRLAGVR